MFNFFRKKKDEEGRKKTKEPERPPRKTELKKMGNNHSKLDDEDPLKKSFNNDDRPMKETFQKPTEEDNTVKETDEISKISFTDVSNEEKPGDEQALSFDEDIMDADEEEIEELMTEKSENPPEIMNDSRAKFFDDLLGGDTKVEASVAKAAPVETESPSDEEMISLRSIGLIESFPSIREEDEVTVKKKKHVHWADSEEGKCLESFNEFMTPSSSSEDEEELIEEQVDDDSLEEESEEESEEDDIPDDWREENETKVTENTQENEETESEESEESEEESEKDECTEVAPLENSNSDNTKTEDNVNKTDVESLELRILYSKLTEIQKDLLEKASSLERAQSDLEVAYNEADHAKNKIEKLEKELEEAKKRNTDLARRLSEEYISVEERRRLKDADIRVAELEFKLREMRGEREKLEASFSVLRMDRDKEIQNVKDALNAALNEKKEQEIKYQKEFENLRTLNSGREVQMLDDFEWKLREVEKLGKKKIAEAVLERDRMISDLSSKLEKAEADLEQLVELKACEIELKQLKVTSAEQRKNLRLIQRKLEDLQVNEMILQEEVNRLRIALDKEKAAMASLQVLHKEEIAEKERKLLFKLEYQKNQTNIEWEEKLKRESAKLKSDLERSFREEKMVAVDTAKRLKDNELANQRHNYEKKVQDLKTEIDGFKERLKLKENKHQVELQKAQTNTDREVLDKRRQLDKLDMTYQEKIEKLQEQYEKEISLLKAENEKKVAQIESGYQQQIGTTRTTLELVKQSMMDENQKKMENLIRKHEREMAEQWEKLQVAKEREIQEIQTSHRKTVELLQLQLDVLRKSKGRIEDMTEKTDLLVGDHTTKFSQSPFSSRLEPEGGPKEENFEENSTEDVQEMEGKDENQEVLDKSEKAKPHRNRRRNRRRKN